MSKELAARIRAQNAAGKRANELHPLLVLVFTPFVGRKVVKKDGTFVAALQKELKIFTGTYGSTYIYSRVTKHCVYFCVKVHESVEAGGRQKSEECSCTVADIKDGMLKEFCKPCNYKTDHDYNDVVRMRSTHDKAKDALSEALNDLYPFGEYDY